MLVLLFVVVVVVKINENAGRNSFISLFAFFSLTLIFVRLFVFAYVFCVACVSLSVLLLESDISLSHILFSSALGLKCCKNEANEWQKAEEEEKSQPSV